MLKDAASTLAEPLSFIINLSLRTSSVPLDWKSAKIIPLHKSGDTTLESNYRPISILPVVSKILEKAVHHQLLHYLEFDKLLSKNQFGYRKRRSTELATILLTDSIRKCVDNGDLVVALFIDLFKAFDTLSHTVLPLKLKSYCIKGIALNWFTDYLFNRKQFCFLALGNVEPDYQHLVCGVPQGSTLGPILFLLYFNDFEDCLIHSKVIQFADDTLLFVSS
jgi:hypothetical protein